MDKKVLVPLAEGFEETEAITIIDLLRRGGIEVTTAGLDNQPVRGSHGITVVPDTTLDQALKADYDMVALPGGLPGADNLENDPRILGLLRSMAESGKWVAAICAAPKVLAKAGLLDGKQATSYPGFLDRMDVPGMTYLEDPVVRDGHLLTSRGPGTAMDFALELIGRLQGEATRRRVEDALMRPSYAAAD